MLIVKIFTLSWIFQYLLEWCGVAIGLAIMCCSHTCASVTGEGI